MRNYRGLTKEGKWVYGWYVGEGFKCSLIIPTSGGYGSYGSTDSDKTMIGPVLEVLPETVGHNTGLKDRNGKEIYEGDIVCGMIDDEKHTWDISWETDDMLGWSIDNTNEPLEVIGNIHQTPELLEQENE